jgi:hypothetical protein
MVPVVPNRGSVDRRRPSIPFLALAGLVILGSVAIRLALLGRQSYWIDELFSANQASGSFHHLVRVGSTEVHTPFYAGLLWAWMKVGGSHEVWTRLLSTIFAVAAVLVTGLGLRPVRLDPYLRWALIVATAAGGTSIVYSLETRSYALLLLGAVGLTVSTLRAGVLILNRAEVPRRTGLTWVSWVALAATAHLFGAVLTLGAVAVLAVLILWRGPQPAPVRLRRVLGWAALAAVGCAGQAAWLVRGLGRPGFADGTDWIKSPRAADVWALLTTTFSSGGLTPRKDGFAWTSPIGVFAVLALAAPAVLALLAAGVGARARSRAGATDPANLEPDPEPEPSVEAQAAAILLALAAVVIGSSLVISQFIHLWTLRNMIIVAPALSWGAICLVAAAAGTATGRRRASTVVVALLGLSLVPTAIGVAHPYKTDFRGLIDYLIAERAEQPDARFVFLGHDLPWDWHTASDRPADDPAWATLYRHVTLSYQAGAFPKKPKKGAAQPAGTEIVTYYHGVAYPRLDQQTAALLARLGGAPACRSIPFYDLTVIQCRRPG